ncbi:MAG: hypothetical protein JW803_08855 [Endomicrobiales bacterium]|nr:hypothetical protein [Endomicrobiales bacterium]
MQNTGYKVIVFVAVAGLMCGKLYAGNRAHFLTHGPSVGAYGLAEAATALNGDISYSFFNPAHLASLKSNSIGLAHFPLVEGTMYNYAQFSLPVLERYGAGISAINLRSGDVEIRQNINDTPEIINTNQWAYNLTFARRFSGLYDTNIGLNLKVVSYSMYKYSANGYGADIGASKKIKGPMIFGEQSTIDTGVSLLNIVQPAIKLVSEEERLGGIYRIGAAITLPTVYRLDSMDSIALAVDGVYQEENAAAAVGVDYIFMSNYHVRAGGFKDHFTIGLGGRIQDFEVNYAMDLSAYDNLSKFGFAYNWGEKKQEKAKKKKELDRAKADKDLLEEAKQKLNEAEQIEQARRKEARPLYRDAMKDYKKKRYLMAADKFRSIMIEYPEYSAAEVYYNKIENNMGETSQQSLESDFEKVSYAKGYVDYREQKFGDALNEWSKVLQLNPKRDELKEYSERVQAYLKDEERREKEKEIEARIAKAYDGGVADYNAARWVSCIKKMENVQSICKNEPIPTSLEWNNKAAEYIDRSIKEIARIAKQKAPEEKAKQQEIEVDVEGSRKKYNEGLVLYAQGKIAEAVRVWEIAVRLDPDNQKAKRAIEKGQEELDLNKKK